MRSQENVRFEPFFDHTEPLHIAVHNYSENFELVFALIGIFSETPL